MDNPAPLETQDRMKKSSRLLWPATIVLVFLIATVVGTYAWFSLMNRCEVNAVEDASALLLSQMKRYDKEYQFTATVPYTSLMHPLRVLQQIHVDTEEVVVPACLQTAKNELVSYMRAVIRAFRAYEAQEANGTIRDLIDESEAHYDNFTAELEAVKECAPYCW